MVDDDDLSPDAAFSEKAQLDTEELGGSPSEDKVELDLDDAPFLEEEEEEEPEEESPPSSDPVLLEEPEEKKQSIKDLLKNKKVLIALGGVLLLVIGVVVAMLFMGDDPPPPPPPKPKKKVVQQQPQPSAPIEPKFEGFTVTWDPFWVEKRDNDGKLRFLVCKFAAVTENEKLAYEAGTKKVVIRDAIFYYLRNKSLLFLADKSNVDVLKSDLLAVINQYLDNGQLEELLIENYLVK